MGVCIVGAGGFGLIRTRVSRVEVFSRTCAGRDQRRAAHASNTRLCACLWSEFGGCGRSGGGEEMCGKKGVLETVRQD